MSADLTPPVVPPNPKSSRFTVASWIVVLGGVGLTILAYNIAVYYRRPGEWLPGLGVAILGFISTAVLTFGCGLTAILRKEPRWKLALLPFLAGAGTLAYVAWKMITR